MYTAFRLFLLSLVVSAPVGHGQVSQSGSVSLNDSPIRLFAVSSVRLNTRNDGRFRLGFTNDGYEATGVTPKLLIQDALGIYEDAKLFGIPGWGLTQRYDVYGKVDIAESTSFNSLSLADKRLLLQDLLERRFNMKFHRETRTEASYSLMLAKHTALLAPQSPVAPNAGNPGQFPHGALWTRMSAGRWTAEHCSTSELARVLALQLLRPVIDNTGMSGTYRFTLEWDPRNGTVTGIPSATQDANDSHPSGPSLFTALREQLGLELKPMKSEVGVVVIDSLSTPSPN